MNNQDSYPDKINVAIDGLNRLYVVKPRKYSVEYVRASLVPLSREAIAECLRNLAMDSEDQCLPEDGSIIVDAIYKLQFGELQ